MRWRGATAEVELLEDVILKWYDEEAFGIAGEELAAREALWLLRLRHEVFVPRLHHLQGRMLAMSYAGEPAPFPADHERQIEHISLRLEAHDCFHRDIYSTRWGDVKNVLVHEGRLMLIDFTWATSLAAPEPLAFAPHLGEMPDKFALLAVAETRG